MKNLKSIGLYFLYPFSTFLLGIFTHIAYLNFFYPNKYYSFENSVYQTQRVYEASTGQDAVTTCDTECIVIEYNLKDHTSNEYIVEIPEKYLGLSRMELQEELKEYEISPTLEDQQKGFLNMQLESFSDKEIRIGKNYSPIEKNQGYFLMVQEGKIVVMREDRKTIYLTTDIYVDALSDSLKQELIVGKFIYNIEELYGFLESYTS